MRIAAFILAALVFSLSALCADGDARASADKALAEAEAYERDSGYHYARVCAGEYLSLLGECGASVTELRAAGAYVKALSFEPRIHVSPAEGARASDGVFIGSDGAYIPGTSAYRFSVKLGETYVKDYLSLIPSIPGELCVLVTFETGTGEKILRSVSEGKYDKYLTENLRALAKIDGRVYVSFSPAPDRMKSTATSVTSFVSAFRHFADIADRYAPRAGVVYTVSDLRTSSPVYDYYPGDGYADAVGVVHVNTAAGKKPYCPESALTCRGAYNDPLLAFTETVGELRGAGVNLPVIVEGISVPWAGKAAVDGAADELTRFISLAPAVCPSLVAVFYSNYTNADGICNLRQNPEMKEAFVSAAASPYYINHSRGTYATVPCTPEEYRGQADGMTLTVSSSGVFRDVTAVWYLDGEETGSVISPSAGEHILKAYLTFPIGDAAVYYSVTVNDDGTAQFTFVPSEYDLDGDGIASFLDAEIVSAAVANWGELAGDPRADINGDGKIGITDISAYRKIIRR